MAILYDPRAEVVLLIDEFRLPPMIRSEAEWQRIAPEDRPTGRMLSCIGGRLEKDEPPEIAVRRESSEEAGCAVKRAWGPKSVLIWGGLLSTVVTSYVLEFDSSTVREGTSTGVASENEDIKLRLFSLDQLNDLVDQTSLVGSMDALSQSTVGWFLREQPKIKAAWTNDLPEPKALIADRPDQRVGTGLSPL